MIFVRHDNMDTIHNCFRSVIYKLWRLKKPEIIMIIFIPEGWTRSYQTHNNITVTIFMIQNLRHNITVC
jgi:hypothetical protein